MKRNHCLLAYTRDNDTEVSELGPCGPSCFIIIFLSFHFYIHFFFFNEHKLHYSSGCANDIWNFKCHFYFFLNILLGTFPKKGHTLNIRVSIVCRGFKHVILQWLKTKLTITTSVVVFF